MRMQSVEYSSVKSQADLKSELKESRKNIVFILIKNK